MNNACRHFLGMLPDRQCCAMGRDIRKNAIAANGGSAHGIGLRLPCTKSLSEETPLFDCPDLDRKSNEEVAEQERKAREEIAATTKGLSALFELKKKMIDRGLSVAKATCVWCGEKDTLWLSCNISGNKHLHAKCSNCGRHIME